MAKSTIKKDSDEFKSMFREYDIRGKVNKFELNEESVYEIVSAYARLIKERGIKRVVLGYDNRDCSPAFHDSALKALLEYGMKVYDIGLTLTPVSYYAQYRFEAEGLVMITASHNPNGWSGFKFGLGYSRTLGKEDIKRVYNYCLEPFDYKGNVGEVIEVNVREDYINEVLSRIKMGENKPRVIIETANGGAGLFAYEIFERLGCITFLLNADPDTSYPKYFPNPSDNNACVTIKKLILHPYIHADLGLFFDGDGDRVGVTTKDGKTVYSDIVLALLSKQLLAKHPNEKVIFDVKCSRALSETIEENGGEPIMWSTGHSFIKAKMHQENAILAGERSGHIFIGGDEYFGFDDGIFAGAKLVEFLSNQEKDLTEVVASLPKYVTSPEIYVECADNVKYRVMDKIVKRFKELYPEKVVDINGARVEFDNGWGLVRASSNMPLLGLIFEGKTRSDMEKIKEIFRSVLSEFSEVSSYWQNDDE